MNKAELKEFLDEKVLLYNNPSFIVDDPVQIPHLYTQKEDIEIGGFLSATIAWGNRKMIIKNAHKMMELMGNSPYDFVMNHNEDHLDALTGFVHRTFNSTDFATFIQALQHIYRHHRGLEGVFSDSSLPLQERISKFKTLFFEIQHQQRTQKHISDPLKGSAAKRINMYLRWMVRQDNAGVDFGIWKGVSPSELSCPLDVHSGNMARKLGILKRTQNDAKALLELDTALRELDPVDPVKYDFALFGLGAIEKF
ncbi:TIGR02757 family protein [Myroides sp. TSA_177.3]|uniref:TIGR02757 family protein n=1 Tax=Myroides sp. TSA_177.3 TaxID=3415650 RepID=UPI0040453CC1